MSQQISTHSCCRFPKSCLRRPSYAACVIRAGLCAVVVVVVLFSSFAPLSAQAASQPERPLAPLATWDCSGVYHSVQAGESLYSIARLYGSTAYRIAYCNGLSSYRVYVGETLLVPIIYRRYSFQTPTPPTDEITFAAAAANAGLNR